MKLTEDELRNLGKGNAATMRLKKITHKIPLDLMSHPLFKDSAGFIYCISKEEIERFFTSIRRDLMEKNND